MSSSDAETELELYIKAAGLPAPVREFKFHPTRKWRTDFAWPEHKVLLEVEGGVWMKGGGGHSHPFGILRDIEKYNESSLMGYRTFRVTTDMVRNGEALTLLERIFLKRS